MAKGTCRAQDLFRLAWRRGPGGIARTMRGADRALQGITAEAVARWRLNTRARLAGATSRFAHKLSTKFANRLTGSEYFQWVRRLRAQNISERQSRRIALRFVGRARTISKGSMLIFRWGN